MSGKNKNVIQNLDDSFVIKGRQFNLDESGIQKSHSSSNRKVDSIRYKGVNQFIDVSPFVQYRDDHKRMHHSNFASEPLTPIFKSNTEAETSLDHMSFQTIDESIDPSFQIKCPKSALNSSPTESPGPFFLAKSRLEHLKRHSSRTTSTPCSIARYGEVKMHKDALEIEESFESLKRNLFSACHESSKMDVDPFEEDEEEEEGMDECKGMEKETSSTGMSWKEGMSNLIGDMSAPYKLPLHPSKHQDLKAISPDTMAGLLRGQFDKIVEKYMVVDCRYPYEYEGGHIKGAINICSQDHLLREFFCQPSHDLVDRQVIIFHCEFSSERAPKMMKFLRKRDRDENSYPTLHYPELYLLEGGYKAFFQIHPVLCNPSSYRPMNHPDYINEYRIMHSKSKSEKDEIAKTAFKRKAILFKDNLNDSQF